MTNVNYAYFLYGIVIFFAWRLFHLFNYFKRTPYPRPSASSVIFFLFGSGYILLLINMFQNVDLSYGFDYLVLLPSIFMILGIINFYTESFIAPTINYLIALGFGTLIGIITYFISDLVFLNTGIESITSYLALIPSVLGLVIGGIAGILFYAYFLKPRYLDWNSPLWQRNKVWDIINSHLFLLTIAILAFIEATLQLQANSLVYVFSAL